MDITLYFEYEPYTVTLNFLEKGTNKSLANSKICNYKSEESFNLKETNPKKIKGYEFVEMTGQLVGTFEGTPEERVNNEVAMQISKLIDVYYKPVDQIKDYKVEFNYYEELTGKKLAESTEDIVLNNENYDFTTINPPKIKGYKNTSTNGDVKGKVNGKNFTVNLYYKKVNEVSGKYRVINIYYLKDGEEAPKTGDDNNLILWIRICVLAIFVVFILNKKSRKK